MIKRLQRTIAGAAAVLLLCVAAEADERFVPIPTDGRTMADLMLAAETLVWDAAQSAGLPHQAKLMPLPPNVVIPLAAEGSIMTEGDAEEFIFWKGAMLPDQLAPEEYGRMVVRTRKYGELITLAVWKAPPPLEPFDLPAPEKPDETLLMTPGGHLIETLYDLGTVDGHPVQLYIWRGVEENSAIPAAGVLFTSWPADESGDDGQNAPAADFYSRYAAKLPGPKTAESPPQ